VISASNIAVISAIPTATLIANSASRAMSLIIVVLFLRQKEARLQDVY
jgi:hypothetical protein